MRRALALLLVALPALPPAAAGTGPENWTWTLPPAFPPPVVPVDNPMSAAKVALGKRLFFDTSLSENNRIACATCHQPARAYSDAESQPRGAHGDRLSRNAPSLTNVAYAPALGWTDEGVTTFEAQMRRPLFATQPVENDYRSAFADAFPGEPAPLNMDNLIRAIASFERTLISGRSAFDRYVFDDDRPALIAAARRGMALFYSKRAGCATCHGGLTFSGSLRAVGNESATAVYAHTGVAGAAVKFKVPGLRNVALTAPYMHDGSLASLRAVIDFYDRGGGQRRLKRLALREKEKGDLVAFLESLTDPAFVSSP